MRRKRYDDDFEQFWKKWKGRWNGEKYVKVGKFEAWEEWQRLDDDEKEQAIAVANRVSGKYAPDAMRWLKRKRFDDYTVKL